MAFAIANVEMTTFIDGGIHISAFIQKAIKVDMDIAFMNGKPYVAFFDALPMVSLKHTFHVTLPQAAIAT